MAAMLRTHSRCSRLQGGSPGSQRDPDYVPMVAGEHCGRTWHTCYMGTENSGVDACRRRGSSRRQSVGLHTSFLFASFLRFDATRSYHTDDSLDDTVVALPARDGTEPPSARMMARATWRTSRCRIYIPTAVPQAKLNLSRRQNGRASRRGVCVCFDTFAHPRSKGGHGYDVRRAV